MSGKIDLATYAILGLAAAAAATDLAFGRIFNWLTFGMTLAGLAFLATTQGLPGVQTAFLGALAGLLLYGWMFALGILGGGDVKLLMAFGAWGGWQYSLDVAMLGILLGGAMALILMLAQGRMADFLSRAKRFFMSLLIRELELEKFQVDRKMTMPFGVPIAIAAAWVRIKGPVW